jgi:hypothetical protein
MVEIIARRRLEQAPLVCCANAVNDAVAELRQSLKLLEHTAAESRLVGRMQGRGGAVNSALLVVREGLCHEWASRVLFGQVDPFSLSVEETPPVFPSRRGFAFSR